MILDDLNKTRQLMLKNPGSRTELPRANPQKNLTDMKSLAMVVDLDKANHPTVWAPNTTAYNNPILPVFPRDQGDELLYAGNPDPATLPARPVESTSNATSNATNA